MLNKEDPLASVIHLISLNEIDYKFCSAYLLNQSLMILIVGTVPECGISGRCCTLLHLPFLSWPAGSKVPFDAVPERPVFPDIYPAYVRVQLPAFGAGGQFARPAKCHCGDCPSVSDPVPVGQVLYRWYSPGSNWLFYAPAPKQTAPASLLPDRWTDLPSMPLNKCWWTFFHRITAFRLLHLIYRI